MSLNRSTKVAACVAILCTAIGALYLLTRTLAHAQARPSLEVFFETVLQNPVALPKHEDLHKLTLGVANMRTEEIMQSLPAIFSALAYEDEKVKAYACAALFAIADRPDGAELLKSRINAIGHDLLTSQFEHVQGGEVVILGRLRPTPPETVPLLLTFLKEPGRSANVQGGAIFELVHIAPQDPEVVAAIQEFSSRPLDNSVRIGLLNALGNPSVKDPQIIKMMIASLDDADTGVRSTAVQALMRMDQHALQQAEPALHRLANDPKQPAEVAANAKQALQRLHPPKQ